MMRTRSIAEPRDLLPASTLRPGLLAAVVALVLAGLACTRADVRNGGGIAATQAPAASATLSASITPVPTDEPSPATTAPEPTATETPTPEAPEPVVSPTAPPTPTLPLGSSPDTVTYPAQPGDSLRSVAIRFGVVPSDITTPGSTPIPSSGLIDPGTILVMPRRLGVTGPSEHLVPDSEIVFSPNAADVDVVQFVQEQGGYLGRYQEYVGGRMRTGSEVLAMVARDNSVNPRVLLAILEYQTGWVTSPDRPTAPVLKFPLGHTSELDRGLFRQLTWAANELGNGYYGWRAGSLTELAFNDATVTRIAPDLNAGTVALHYYFSRLYDGRRWAEAVSPDGFPAAYSHLHGDPFDYEYAIYEPGESQPEMILPFLPGHVWAFTGGPHGAWERESAWAALDFAPPSLETGCAPSDEWIAASAPGLVVRSDNGVVVLDLDGDGREQTGWVLLYLHVAEAGRVREGDFVEQGGLIGHPSCEGGVATGTHVHLARKYNGEWVLADGPLPFTLSGWVAQAGARPYQGALLKGDDQILACTCASAETRISR
jgi:murein DD-endopeptidase MepM/ murein hydrolase activator NlpD